ncbi:hypothetical protein GINT2_001899 [Glugoides intestinalis]
MILKAIVSPAINTIITSKRTLDTCLDQLAGTKYPAADRFKYDRDINNIKQEDFYRIDQYSLAIHQAFVKYCLCANLKPNEQTQRAPSSEHPIKYCKKHGNYYHDTKDCRSLKQTKNKHDGQLNKKDSSYVLRIPCHKNLELQLKGLVN